MPTSTDTPVAFVLHRCPTFATGRVHGPGAVMTAWWATLGLGTGVWDVTSGGTDASPEVRARIRQAIALVLPRSAADEVRQLQDERGEALA